MTCAIIGAFFVFTHPPYFFTHRPYYIYNQMVKKLRFFADLLAIFRRLYLFLLIINWLWLSVFESRCKDNHKINFLLVNNYQ